VIRGELRDDSPERARRLNGHERDRHERAVLALDPPFDLGPVGPLQPHPVDGTRRPVS
jgi:hypothetical protein